MAKLSMLKIDELESQRVEMLYDIILKKTKFDRNKYGQFATPVSLSDEIIMITLNYINKPKIVFLDPAMGSGTFFSSLLRANNSNVEVEKAIGFETDSEFTNLCQKIWSAYGLEIHLQDFTKAHLPKYLENVDLIVCNPPYSRHHHITSSDKKRLIESSQQITDITPSGLSGLYYYFMFLSHKWLKEGGMGVWIIPSEFLNSKTGKSIRQYLTNNVKLKRVHIFDAIDVQFNDALVSSSVIWFEKGIPDSNEKAEFTYNGSISNSHLIRHVPIEELKLQDVWPSSLRGSQVPIKSACHVSKFFTVKRGLATGSNGFFILDYNKAAEFKIPSQFLYPILDSPLRLKEELIDAAYLDKIKGKQRFLLNVELEENVIQKRYPHLWSYLEIGVAKGIDKHYLCSHRKNWYYQERREPAPFLITPAGILGKKGGPFRVIQNDSKCLATNSFICLYPIEDLGEKIIQNHLLKQNILNELKTIVNVQLINSCKIYGGGLMKFEPSQLANADATNIAVIIESHELLRG